VLALAFDTSTTTVSVAVVHSTDVPREGSFITAPPTLLAGRGVSAPNAQGETLAPLIDEVCRAGGVALTDLDVVGVGLGPGPFTGLRVGVVTAAGLADALGIPVHGMCSLDAIARAQVTVAPFAVVTDARRKQVYWATYGETGERTGGPDLAPPADLARMLTGKVHVVAGAGALLHADVFTGLDVRSENPWPSAYEIGVHALAESIRGNESGRLEPLYLRRPDARLPGAPKRVTPT
jgi:tRNA threonylcarbamoyl adenosine modification protein YeaZ